MNAPLVLAKNTFKETIRDRILYGIAGFSFVYILLTLFFAKLSLGNLVMIKSFGLAGIYLFGLVVTIFLGSSIIDKEIDKRTLYFVLSKPVSRRDVIVGKFLGLGGSILLTITLMAVVYVGVLLYAGILITQLDVLAILLQMAEALLFVALLIFFSSFTRPLLATLSALIILFSGHLMSSAFESAKKIGGITYEIIRFLYYTVPNLEKFNIRNLAVHNISPSGETLFFTFLYGVLYTTFLLYAAHLIFKKREL